mmetsp:Transcript_23202/g.36969  ORF Transcript_23202/g.36969 Transcript_23202/m.36969 type:complete len:209 (+) Transcript_23202:70-696(+)
MKVTLIVIVVHIIKFDFGHHFVVLLFFMMTSFTLSFAPFAGGFHKLFAITTRVTAYQRDLTRPFRLHSVVIAPITTSVRVRAPQFDGKIVSVRRHCVSLRSLKRYRCVSPVQVRVFLLVFLFVFAAVSGFIALQIVQRCVVPKIQPLQRVIIISMHVIRLRNVGCFVIHVLRIFAVLLLVAIILMLVMVVSVFGARIGESLRICPMRL